MLTDLCRRWSVVAGTLLLAAPLLGHGKVVDSQATASSLLALYDAGRYGDVDQMLAQDRKGPLASALRREGDRWVKTGPADTLDRRRMIAGAVALEIVGAGLTDEWFDVYEAIEWGCRHVVETTPGTQAEHSWHLGSISLLQSGAGIAPTVVFADGHLTRHSLKRVPESLRLKLVAVIDEERAVAPPPPRRTGQGEVRPEAMLRFNRQVAEVAMHYVALVTASEVADEARLRLGAFQYRLGSLDEALAVLAPLTQSKDPHIGYVSAFLTGEAQRRKGRGAEAQAAYRQALRFAPNAMSASLGLSAVLAASGNLDAAIAAADGAATIAAPLDPWRLFAYGAGRQWPQWRDALRKELRR